MEAALLVAVLLPRARDAAGEGLANPPCYQQMQSKV